jgi:hypothetical protein
MAGVPPPPREPSPQARALLFRPDARQLGWLIGGGVFTLVGLILSIVFCRGVPAEVALLASHQYTTGRIVGRHVQTNVTVNGAHPTVLDFSYVVNGLEMGASSSCVHCAEAGRAIGSELEVEFVPAWPDFAKIRGLNYGLFPIWLGFILVLPVLGVWALSMGLSISRRRARAFRSGEEAPGQITYSGFDMNVNINGRNPRRVVWSFEKNGKTYTGALSRMALPEFRQGDNVTVLHDPDDPSVNVLWIE